MRNDISIEEKLVICEELVEEFDEEIMMGKNTHTINYFLTGLANYLCWHKGEFYRDKEKGILSNSREKQMDRKIYHGRYRKDTPFTDLGTRDTLTLFGELDE